LATAIATDPGALFRMLRLLASASVFTETSRSPCNHPELARAVLRNQAIHARAFLYAGAQPVVPVRRRSGSPAGSCSA